jgi:hypothetical protein
MRIIAFLCVAGLAFGQMSSASYEIPTHVLDGGGTSSSSTSYELLNAVGQPTPIGTATSTSYQGYLGYIYTIPMGPPTGLCGDVNNTGTVTSADGYHILNYFGAGTPPSSCWAANVNGDSDLYPSDGYYLLNYFGAGPPLNCQPCVLTVPSGSWIRPDMIRGRSRSE